MEHVDDLTPAGCPQPLRDDDILRAPSEDRHSSSMSYRALERVVLPERQLLQLVSDSQSRATRASTDVAFTISAIGTYSSAA